MFRPKLLVIAASLAACYTVLNVPAYRAERYGM